MLGKSVGSLRNLPYPPAAVLEEALKLLLTFGDGKAIGSLLEQVREVQANNEKVFDETQKALAELRVSQKALDDSHQEYVAHVAKENAELRNYADKLAKSDAQLNVCIASFDQEKKEAVKEIDEANKDIATRDQLVARRESNCTNKEQELVRRESDLNQRESAFDARQKQQEAKERKLRAVLDGG